MTYLLIGIGFYIGLVASNLESFKGTTIAGVCRGLTFGILLWPLAAIVVVLYNRDKKSETTHPIRDYP